MKNKSAFLKAKLILASKYASSSWAFFQWSPWDNWCDHIWTEQLWWLYGWCNGSRVTWTSGSLAGTESHATKRETSWVKILTKNEITVDVLANSSTLYTLTSVSIFSIHQYRYSPYNSFCTGKENEYYKQIFSGWWSVPLFSIILMNDSAFLQ